MAAIAISVSAAAAAVARRRSPAHIQLVARRRLPFCTAASAAPAAAAAGFSWADALRVASDAGVGDESDLSGYFRKVDICNRGMDKKGEFVEFLVEDQVVGYIHKGRSSPSAAGCNATPPPPGAPDQQTSRTSEGSTSVDDGGSGRRASAAGARSSSRRRRTVSYDQWGAGDRTPSDWSTGGVVDRPRRHSRRRRWRPGRGLSGKQLGDTPLHGKGSARTRWTLWSYRDRRRRLGCSEGDGSMCGGSRPERRKMESWTTAQTTLSRFTWRLAAQGNNEDDGLKIRSGDSLHRAHVKDSRAAVRRYSLGLIPMYGIQLDWSTYATVDKKSTLR